MEQFDLGPNGAMLYCLEYLEKNVDWLVEKLDGLTQKYLIFDFPGQVEVSCNPSCSVDQLQQSLAFVLSLRPRQLHSMSMLCFTRERRGGGGHFDSQGIVAIAPNFRYGPK